MSTEKMRKAIQARLEEIYETDLEYQYNLSKIVTPFDEFFKKARSTSNKKDSSDKNKQKYKKLLMQEL
ncbi:MAG: hypothetical protein ACXABG_00005 [Promethearchaeota archaeon]|jgi:hypothetical protein